MIGDYLDLLLVRETRAAPLAEPRIEPVSAAAAPALSSGWNEIVEERAALNVPSLGVEARQPDGKPRRPEVEPQAQVNAAVFPPPPDRSLEPPELSERQPPPMAARIAAEDGRQQPPAPHRVQPPEVIAATVATAPATIASVPAAASGEARVPQLRMRTPDGPREIATRPAAPVRGLGAEPPVAQPITIRIDRVEVRAAAAARPPAPAGPRPRPRVTLEEFLARRSGPRHE